MNFDTIRADGEPGYNILLGRGLLDELANALGSAVRKTLIVYPEALEASATLIAESLRDSSKEVWLFPVADGEAAKTDQWLAAAWSY
ncbi:MAG: 3-dehydroquinate synthase, partial [Actinomycetes bacterium]